MTLVFCIFTWAGEHVTVSVWRSKDNLGEQLVLSPHQTDHGAQTQGCGKKCLCFLSHLISLMSLF